MCMYVFTCVSLYICISLYLGSINGDSPIAGWFISWKYHPEMNHGGICYETSLSRYNFVSKWWNNYIIYQVVPHKAVAEVSK